MGHLSRMQTYFMRKTKNLVYFHPVQTHPQESENLFLPLKQTHILKKIFSIVVFSASPRRKTYDVRKFIDAHV